MNLYDDFSDYSDNRLLGERSLILDNLAQIHQAIENSNSPIPEDEAERYNGLQDELSDIEAELENRGYVLNPDSDEFEEGDNQTHSTF